MRAGVRYGAGAFGVVLLVLIAPVLAHLATNGLALAVAWFTVSHGRWP